MRRRVRASRRRASIAGLVVVLGRGGGPRRSRRTRCRRSPPSPHRVEELRGLEFKAAAEGPQGHREGSCSASRTASSTASAPTQRRARALRAGPAQAARLREPPGAAVRPRQHDRHPRRLRPAVQDARRIVTDAQGSRAQKELTLRARAHARARGPALRACRPSTAAATTPAIARRALVEGSARFTEIAYAREHLGANVTAQGPRLARPRLHRPRARSTTSSTPTASPTSTAAATSPSSCARAGRTARDAAFRQPPKATADVLHPTPDSRRPRAGASSTSAGSPRASSASRPARWASSTPASCSSSARSSGTPPGARPPPAPRASAAGRYELWRAGSKDIGGCSRPCVERDLLAIRWRFESPEQAEQFAAELPAVPRALPEARARRRRLEGRRRRRRRAPHGHAGHLRARPRPRPRPPRHRPRADPPAVRPTAGKG